jgi:hypothetical protein
MHEYRERSNNNEQVPAVNAEDYSRDNVPTRSILKQYGLEEELEVDDFNDGVQTVEEEYQSYGMGKRSSLSLDILRFWEVNGDVVVS